MTFPALVAAALKDGKVQAARCRLLGRHRPRVACLRAAGCRRSASMPARPNASVWPRLERNPDVSYVAAFVSSVGQTSRLISRPARRRRLIMQHARSHELHAHARDPRSPAARQPRPQEKLRHNAWEMTGLADPTQADRRSPICSAERGWTDLDYLKIDIDGADFDILQSLKGASTASTSSPCSSRSTSSEPTSPTSIPFTIPTASCAAQGFDLFRLDVRNFSSRALPARYIWPTPAETVSGRPFQGEAYYARDVLAPHRAGGRRRIRATRSSPSSRRYSRLGMCLTPPPSCCSRAATSLTALFDVDAGLDLLAAQTQPKPPPAAALSRDYMATFEARPARVLPARRPGPDAGNA